MLSGNREQNGNAGLGHSHRKVVFMGLIMHRGTPHWWLSRDIWVTKEGAPETAHVAHPIAGDPYNVYVRAWNPTSTTITLDDYWSLNIV
jgi:hypothetical protein